MQKIVLTGAPSSGKTTLIGSLADRGFSTVPESDMQVIEMYKKELGGVEAWKDFIRPDGIIHKIHFTQFILRAIETQIDNEDSIPKGDGIIFLDRGTPDYLSFATLRGVDITKKVRDRVGLLTLGYQNIIHLPVIPANFSESGETGRVITLEEAREFDLINKDIWKRPFLRNTTLKPGISEGYIKQVITLVGG